MSRLVRPAAVAGVLFLVSSVAGASPDLSVATELQALKDRIAQLEASQQRVDGAELQAKAIDAAITDADSKRAFLQADGFTSGWENGFKLQSADGAYVLQPFVESQFRYTANDTEEAGDGDDDFQGGFEWRRVAIGLKGNAFGKNFRYTFRSLFDRSTGEPVLEFGYADFQFARDWAVRFGQFKLDWTHEETVGFSRQLAVDRSLLNQLFGGGNTYVVQGVSLIYGTKQTPVHASVTLTDGDRSLNTNYTDQQGSTTTRYQNFGVAARGEYKVLGKWDSYGDFTARKTTADFLVVGGGVDWAQSGDGDVGRFTVDAQFENASGVSLYGSTIYTLVRGDSPDLILDRSWGALAQAGYLLPGLTDWEIFGRYSYLRLDDDTAPGRDSFHELTVGLNRYFVGHNAKWTLDTNYLPNGSYTGVGGLGVTNSESRQVIFRTQLQLML